MPKDFLYEALDNVQAALIEETLGSTRKVQELASALSNGTLDPQLTELMQETTMDVLSQEPSESGKPQDGKSSLSPHGQLIKDSFPNLTDEEAEIWADIT